MIRSLIALGALLIVGLGSNACAQSLIEYSTVAAKPAPPSIITDRVSRVADKVASKTGAASEQPGPRIVEVDLKGKTPAVPAAPAVFILSNGERLESNHYLVRFDSVQVQQAGTQRTIPWRTINLDATIAANRQRGIDLKIPKNKDQVMLGF